MKKIIIVSIIIISFLLFLSSCGISNFEYIYTAREQEKIGKELLRCLNENDNYSLKNLFCMYSIELNNFDEQLQEAIEFFEGVIVSYDYNKRIANSDSRSFRPGIGLAKIRASGIMFDIKTDADKKYQIEFFNYLLSAEDEKKVGISQIIITLLDEGENVIGEIEIGELIE